MDIKQDLFTIISEYVEAPVDNIDIDEALKFSSGLNSFVFLSMISTIEEHFCVTIPNEKLLEFNTLGDIIKFLEENVKQ